MPADPNTDSAASEVPAAPPAQPSPAASQPAQAFVPYHNDLYRFGPLGLGGVRGDLGPALRIASTFLFILLTMGAICFACWFTVFWAKP